MKLYDDPYNSDDLQKKSEDSSYRPRMIYFGILLILAGAIWLLNSFGIISRHTLDVLFSWQMLITVIGLYLVVQRQYYWGGITTVVGLCLLIFDLILPYDLLSKEKEVIERVKETVKSFTNLTVNFSIDVDDRTSDLLLLLEDDQRRHEEL